MCSGSVFILKMIPLAFHFCHYFPTPHTDNFTRIFLGLTTALACTEHYLCARAYVLPTMFKRAFGQRSLACWNQNVPGDVCNSVAVLDGFPPTHPVQ